MSSKPLGELSAARQIRFHQILVGARKTMLRDALLEALGNADPIKVKEQVLKYVPSDVQTILARAGVRDEFVFPTPVLLETKPTLVGYYRLLLGIPQKTFYGSATGMGRFKSMEAKGNLNVTQRASLDEFCRVMSNALSEMVRQISPSVTQQDISELPLLTLGSQMQGGNNNVIGRQAAVDVFLAICDAVKPFIVERSDNRALTTTPSGRTFIITLAGDPDVTIDEEIKRKRIKRVAIEIKGGTDKSNAHNRAGEAEKSHLKAKSAGYQEAWTVIHTKGLDRAKLKSESPSTDRWFDVAQVIGKSDTDWLSFRAKLLAVLELPSGKGGSGVSVAG